MTCRFVNRVAAGPALPFVWLAAVAGACGDSDSSRVTLTLTAPENGQILTLTADDVDPERSGLQFDVEGTSKGIEQGTTIKLFIDGNEQAVSGRVGTGGAVTIPDVTLPPGTHRIHLETSTGSISSDKAHEYTLRALVIESPDDGATITAEDDEDATEPGVQISVNVSAFAIDADEEITLLLDGEEVESKTADDEGAVEYSGITLNNGRHTFRAVAGEGDDAIESGEVTVQVRQSCAAVTFLEPAPPPSGQDSISLGGENCPDPMSGDQFAIRVAISTDAGNGRPVTLFVNGQAVASTVVNGAMAEFEDVVLNRFNSSNEIRVEVENSEGTHCIEEFPGDILVDCAGSDCEIVSPTPVSHVQDGELSLYLNRAMREGEGFDITVESGAELDGREVQLIIDGRTRSPLTETAEASGDSARARFNEVILDEGAHTIEALCTDAAGNVTSSGEKSWIVDVTACDVAVVDPAEDALFVPADDEDAVSDGTQVVVTSNVTGSDCVRQRSAVCDIGEGITGTEFVPYDGSSPLLTIATLDEDGDHAVCVEVEDRAGNVGRGAVGVYYRATAPAVAIESPEDDTRFNVAGGSGYTADADPSGSPTVCDAEFSVLCTEIGEAVQLRRDSATGTVFATAECEEPDNGDPALPSGYNGRARVTAVLANGEQSVVATQSVAGSSTVELVGASPVITLYADCQRPTPVFSDISCSPPGNQLETGESHNETFGVRDVSAGAVIDDIELTMSRDGGASMTLTPSTITGDRATFTGVDLGFDGDGTVTLTAVVTDDFDNVNQATCTVQLASDVPTVAVTAPADNAVFGDGGNCSPAMGDHGVLVTATIDQVADREVDVSVNGAVPSAGNNVTIMAGGGGMGAISVCIPVPDNSANGMPSTIRVTVASTVSGAAVFEERTVSVVTSGPTEGIVIHDLAPADPTDATHRAGVVATWDQPDEDWPGQLVDYELRCANTALAVDADESAKTSWWTAADEVDLPDELTPDVADPEVTLDHRPQEARHCVVRARDAVGNLSPIEESTDLTLVLRQTVIATGEAASGSGPSGLGTRLGARVAAAGDVDGDGLDDVLVGGNGVTQLIFGTADPESPARVLFTSANIIGTSVAGLGDFNGDGRADFAIGNSTANSLAGQVSIFFGRPREQWPASVEIETACNADICLEGAADGRLGRTMAAAGDFDGDGRPDLALGSSGLHQLLIVLGDDYEVRDCTACRASGEMCDPGMDRCVRTVAPGPGSPSFWRLRFAMPDGDAVDPASGPDLKGFELVSAGGLGSSIAALGNFDGLPGDDLAVSASTARQVHYLSGRGYVGPGVQELAATELGLPDPSTGDPDNLPISAIDLSSYGFVIANIGHFYTVPVAGGEDPWIAKPDLGIARSNVNEMYLAPGDAADADDPGFSASEIQITGSGNIGQSIATSFDPVLGLLGDLDGDGEPELCIGTRTADPNDILLWYPDVFAADATTPPVERASGISIPSETTDTAELFVQYVGDFNGDGGLDLAVGDFRANGSMGRLVLIY